MVWELLTLSKWFSHYCSNNLQQKRSEHCSRALCGRKFSALAIRPTWILPRPTRQLLAWSQFHCMWKDSVSKSCIRRPLMQLNWNSPRYISNIWQIEFIIMVINVQTCSLWTSISAFWSSSLYLDVIVHFLYLEPGLLGSLGTFKIWPM